MDGLGGIAIEFGEAEGDLKDAVVDGVHEDAGVDGVEAILLGLDDPSMEERARLFDDGGVVHGELIELENAGAGLELGVLERGFDVGAAPASWPGGFFMSQSGFDHLVEEVQLGGDQGGGDRVLRREVMEDAGFAELGLLGDAFESEAGDAVVVEDGEGGAEDVLAGLGGFATGTWGHEGIDSYQMVGR